MDTSKKRVQHTMSSYNDERNKNGHGDVREGIRTHA